MLHDKYILSVSLPPCILHRHRLLRALTFSSNQTLSSLAVKSVKPNLKQMWNFGLEFRIIPVWLMKENTRSITALTWNTILQHLLMSYFFSRQLDCIRAAQFCSCSSETPLLLCHALILRIHCVWLRYY